MASLNMTPELRAEIYRRLAGVDEATVEGMAAALREQASSSLSRPGRPLVMRARPFRFSGPRRSRVGAPTWRSLVIPLLASGLAGTLAVLTMMSH